MRKVQLLKLHYYIIIPASIMHNILSLKINIFLLLIPWTLTVDFDYFMHSKKKCYRLLIHRIIKKISFFTLSPFPFPHMSEIFIQFFRLSMYLQMANSLSGQDKSRNCYFLLFVIKHFKVWFLIKLRQYWKLLFFKYSKKTTHNKIK